MFNAALLRLGDALSHVHRARHIEPIQASIQGSSRAPINDAIHCGATCRQTLSGMAYKASIVPCCMGCYIVLHYNTTVAHHSTLTGMSQFLSVL